MALRELKRNRKQLDSETSKTRERLGRRSQEETKWQHKFVCFRRNIINSIIKDEVSFFQISCWTDDGGHFLYQCFLTNLFF